MKKRKLKVTRLILLILIIFFLIICIYFVINLLSKKEEVEFNIDDYHINELDYSDSKELDIDLYSNKYILVRLNDFKVLYAKNNSKKFYPASLTKVLTLDTVLTYIDNLNDYSSYSSEQYENLIEDNASLAGLYSDTNYSIEEILYALILPSGADAATCLSNYFNDRNLDLIELMNLKCKDLDLSNSHFTNTTGLHDDDLYTTLDDYTKIVIDTLLNKDAKIVLKTPIYNLDNNVYRSTLYSLIDRDDDIKVYGGKTGFTYEAGLNIMILYEVDNRSYLLILANASGNPYEDQATSIIDANNIFNYLYN